MLPRVERANGVLRVHAVGEDVVDDVDLIVVFDRVVVFVVVNVLRIDAVFLRGVIRLIRMPAHQRGRFRKLRLCKRRHDLPQRQTPEADDRPAELLLSSLSSRIRPRRRLRHRGSEQSRSRSGKEITTRGGGCRHANECTFDQVFLATIVAGSPTRIVPDSTTRIICPSRPRAFDFGKP